jgi:hypothetical protein
MPEKAKNGAPDDAPEKPSTVDQSDGSRNRRPSHREYWNALHTVARFHHINLELLYGSTDHTKPAYEQEFYLQLARVFLQQGGEPDGIWSGAKALVARTALELDVSALVDAHRSRRPGPKYKRRKADEVVGDLTAKSDRGCGRCL